MRFIFLVLVVIQLSACTSPPALKPVDDPAAKWQQNQQALANINHWNLSGRVAIINGHESWHFDIQWQQQHDTYLIDMSGPFGAGHAQLMGSSKGVLFKESDNESYAFNPDQLLLEQTGMRMPLTGLRFWVRGLVDTNNTVETQKINAAGYLAAVEQSGWQVIFKRYARYHDTALPKKIFITGHGVKVKLFIDEWKQAEKK